MIIKKSPWSSLTIACVAIASLSCGSDSTAPTGASFTATVDGQPFVANFAVSAAVGDVYTSSASADVDGVQALSGGSPAATRHIVVKIGGFHGAGTYAIGSSAVAGQSYAFYIHTPSGAGAEPDTNDITVQTNAGSITFTSYDAATQQGAGTFSFTAQPQDGSPGQVVVTDGKFSGRFVPSP